MSSHASESDASEVQYIVHTESLGAVPRTATTRNTGSNRKPRNGESKVRATDNQPKVAEGQPTRTVNQKRDDPELKDTQSRGQQQRPKKQPIDRDEQKETPTDKKRCRDKRSEETMKPHLPIDGENAAGTSKETPWWNKTISGEQDVSEDSSCEMIDQVDEWRRRREKAVARITAHKKSIKERERQERAIREIEDYADKLSEEDNYDREEYVQEAIATDCVWQNIMGQREDIRPLAIRRVPVLRATSEEGTTTIDLTVGIDNGHPNEQYAIDAVIEKGMIRAVARKIYPRQDEETGKPSETPKRKRGERKDQEDAQGKRIKTAACDVSDRKSRTSSASRSTGRMQPSTSVSTAKPRTQAHPEAEQSAPQKKQLDGTSQQPRARGSPGRRRRTGREELDDDPGTAPTIGTASANNVAAPRGAASGTAHSHPE